jgi:cyclohexyl-isocyanide hydratase
MQIAFVLYNGLTALDFIGIHDAVTRLKTMGFNEDICWETCALTERVTATGKVAFEPTAVGEELGRFDVVVVPGCVDVDSVAANDELISWIGTAEGADLLVSVCTGSILLAAAGLLKDIPATTHPTAYDTLSQYCEVIDERIVDTGDIITARGVTSSIDLGLHLCERFADKDTRESIAAQMDYPHYSES